LSWILGPPSWIFAHHSRRWANDLGQSSHDPDMRNWVLEVNFGSGIWVLEGSFFELFPFGGAFLPEITDGDDRLSLNNNGF
jgi:hypothetical protein